MSYPKKDKKSYSDIDLPTNPNLPSWLISPKEEKAIFERWRKKAFAQCDELIKAYVECSNRYKNPIEGMKKCSAINKESLDCVAQYQRRELLDLEREEFIREKMEKKKLYKQRMRQLEEKEVCK